VAAKQPRKKAQRDSRPLVDASAEASAAVRKAASVLEGELSAGLAGVRTLQTRFTKERRIDQAEFDEVLQRFRANAHEFIDVAAARAADLRSPDVQDLSQRLTTDAHDLFDSMISMLGMAPEIINRLAARAEQAVPTPGAAETDPRPPAVAEPSKPTKPRPRGASGRTRRGTRTSK
jgi:hypothetical protein